MREASTPFLIKGVGKVMNEKYEQYLQSPQWKRIRTDRMDMDGGSCQVCGSKENLAVHHITYARKEHEELDDLITLCSECHELITQYVNMIHHICDTKVYEIRDLIRDAVAETTLGYSKSHPNVNMTHKDIWDEFTSRYSELIYLTLSNCHERSGNLCKAVFSSGDIRQLFFNKQKSDVKITAWRDEQIAEMKQNGSTKNEIMNHFAISDNQYQATLERLAQKKV